MSETILLCPRPLARYGGRFVLLPLLPLKPPLKPLPAEIWARIFFLALPADVSQRSHRKATTTSGPSWCVSLMLVCKSFCVSSALRVYQPHMSLGGDVDHASDACDAFSPFDSLPQTGTNIRLTGGGLSAFVFKREALYHQRPRQVYFATPHCRPAMGLHSQNTILHSGKMGPDF